MRPPSVASLLPLLLLLLLLMQNDEVAGQDVYGYPVTDCPITGVGASGFYYIADSVNQCVVWLCFNGNLVGDTPFKCPEGMGIAPGVDGTTYNRCRPLAQCGDTVDNKGAATTQNPSVVDSSQSIADIYNVVPGYYVPNGDPQRGVRDFQTCMYSCIQTRSCRGFDFDALRGICYFHERRTVCEQPVARAFSVHIRLRACETSDSTVAELTAMLPNYHIPNSVVQPGITGFTLCLLGCVDDVTCGGFEVDTRSGTCYFHDDSTVCSQPEPLYYRSLYRLSKCLTTATDAPTEAPTEDPTTQATTEADSTTMTTTPPDEDTSTPTLPVFTQIIRGYHLFMGEFQEDIQDEDECVATCLLMLESNCYGIDWDGNYRTCWFHSLDTECKELMEREGVTHYRLTDKCGPIRTVAPPTIPPATTPTTTTTTTTTTTVPTTLPPLPPPPGYVSVSPGMNAQNAIRRLRDATEQQCLDACLMTSFCLAVDYNTAEMTCWMHGLGSYCNELEVCDNCTHFQRVPCAEGSFNDIVEVNYKFHALDGDEVCVNCPRDDCIAACLSNSSCMAVDYDERMGGICYMHDNTTVCDPLRQKDYCTHYSREPCSLLLTLPGQQQPDDDGTYKAPSGDFMEINHMGPTNLPSGWQAYPGMHVSGGQPILGDPMVPSTGDECLKLCEQDDSCFAVDFDSESGVCFSITSEDLKCAPLDSANHVYHAKKPPVCAFITGTTDPYPESIGTAP